MSTSVTLTLYQADIKQPFTFRSLAEATKLLGHDPDISCYKQVYQETVQEDPMFGLRHILEKFYSRMNRDNRPGAKEFRSLSVSDVVGVSVANSAPQYYYCDTFGFQRIAFAAERPQTPATPCIPSDGLMEGVRVQLSGDSTELWLTDYNCRVCSPATALETPKPRAKKVLVCIDNVDGDGRITAYVRRSKLRPIYDQPNWTCQKGE